MAIINFYLYYIEEKIKIHEKKIMVFFFGGGGVIGCIPDIKFE